MSNHSQNDDENGRKKFNLSAVALDHSSVVWYFMIVFMDESAGRVDGDKWYRQSADYRGGPVAIVLGFG